MQTINLSLDTSLVARHWLGRASALGRPFGCEHALKIVGGRLLADRVLLGWRIADLPLEDFLAWVDEAGMPEAAAAELRRHAHRANALSISVEASPAGTVFKAYLEFWDEVRATVRREGPAEPRCLHLGVKWDSTAPGHHTVAHYLVRPMLTAGDILRRLSMHDTPDGHAAVEVARALVQRGARRRPGVSMIYLEASEAGNPRQSFDINLYKTGQTVASAADLLLPAGRSLGLDDSALPDVLQRWADLPLGHVAGGTDRHGRPFLSLYAGAQTLPD